MAKLNMVQAINQALMQEMERDQNIVMLGEDVGVDGGVFRVTEGLYAKFGRERVIDTPLAESGIIGTSLGMAVLGLKPVAEIQFDGFSFFAFHQIVCHMARMRNRSRGRFSCPLVLRAPYGGGVRALEHHSEAPESYYAHTPGLKIVIPSGPREAKGLLVSAIRDSDPVIYFEPKKLYRAFKEEVPDEPYTIPLGQANVVREGSDVTMVTWGAMLRTTLEAADELKAKGIDCEVIDIRTIAPFDEKTVVSSVEKTGRVVVIHEAPKTLGFGAEIIARINEKAFLSLEAPPVRVTAFDVVLPLPKLEEFYMPDAFRIVRAVEGVMSY